MKDALLINNNFLNHFWIKVIETANFFPNKLFIRNKNHNKLIFEKV